MRTRSTSGFEWRGSFGSLRWLILGTLGVGHACGGSADSANLPGKAERDSSSGQGSSGEGGAGGSSSSTGSAGSANLAGEGVDGGLMTRGVAGTGGVVASGQPSACVFEASVGGGMERCSNGMLHRVSVDSCPSSVPRPEGLVPSPRFPTDAGYDYACQTDNDCTAQPYGHCEEGQGGPYCTYGCSVDADCAANELCSCGWPVGRCELASCRTDAECGVGSLCANNEDCYLTRFSCQQPTDECAVSSDCAGRGQQCRYRDLGDIDFVAPAPGAQRVCQSFSCPVIGRPFLVDGAERLASAVQRADWYGSKSAAAPALTPELARAIADGWTEQALMEHASVAAFARFVLQLLSLGAPAELVSDATRAMQDEIRHARDCFGLARRQLQADIGPGPLPIHGALAESSLREIVVTTVREGCIGETVAALEATEALAHCEDADARAVLERIAVEEGQHAQLAWRFVAWALETAPHAERQALRASIEAVFHAELEATAPATAVSERERELARHGLLSTSLRQALRQRALAEVVAPCAQALLAPCSRALLAPSIAQSANRSSIPSTAQARRVAGRAAT